MKRRSVVVVTPVKNEDWIIERYLAATSIWADHIVVADQNSTDRTREILARYPKVVLIDNPCIDFNEPERQRLLLGAARKIPGEKIIVALDADEIVSANWTSSEDFELLQSAEPGTVGYVSWLNLLPGCRQYWEAPQRMPFFFVDDGTEHSGPKIHSARVPIGSDCPAIQLRETVVLHYQYTDWRRMESKHRWYQVYEVLNNGRTDYLNLLRQYRHMYDDNRTFLPIQESWIAGYLDRGIPMFETTFREDYWWDREVFSYISDPSCTKKLLRVDVWDHDWKPFEIEAGKMLTDCRPAWIRWAVRWAKGCPTPPSRLFDRVVELVLTKFLGF